MMGKIRSTRLDGTKVRHSKPPSAQQTSHIVPGSEVIFFRTFAEAIGKAMASRLQGANLWTTCGK